MGTKIEKTFEIELPDGSKWGVMATAKKTIYQDGAGEKRTELDEITVSDAEMGRFKNAFEKALDTLGIEEWEV